MKSGNHKLFWALTAAILVTGSVSGCTKSKEAGGDPAKAGEKSYTLNVAKTSSSALTNPLIQLAEEKGYFDGYRLELKNTTLETSGTFEALSIGKVDTTYGQLIPPLSYGAQGSDVTLFAGTISGGMCVVVRPENEEELKDLKNWKGKNIGVIQLSTSEMVTKYVLGKDYGYKAGEDLTYTLIDGYPNISLAVNKGTVDIGFISAEYVEGAVSEGLVYLFPLTNLLEDYVCCRQTAYSKSFKDNRAAYVAYLKGQIRAYKDYVKDEAGTVASLAQATGETEDYIKNYIYNKETNGNRTYNPDPNYNGTLAVYDTLLEWDYVEKGTVLSQFYDLSVYADALKAVIEEYPDDTFFTDMWKYFEKNNSEYPNFDKVYGNYL